VTQPWSHIQLIISAGMHADSLLCITINPGNALLSADPDDASAQIDLLGVPSLMISEEPSAAPKADIACRATLEL
jgi:hypothetical protein